MGCKRSEPLIHIKIVKEPLKLNYQDNSKPKIDWNNPEERNQLLNDLISDAEKLFVSTRRNISSGTSIIWSNKQ